MLTILMSMVGTKAFAQDTANYYTGIDENGWFWFNADNSVEVNSLLGTNVILSNGESTSNFIPNYTSTSSGAETTHTGALQIGRNGGSVIFRFERGIKSLELALHRTGSFNHTITFSSDGINYTGNYKMESAKGERTDNVISKTIESPVYVRITNMATGSLQIQGIRAIPADRFAIKNEDGAPIYYSLINEGTNLAVVGFDNTYSYSTLNIPATVTIEGKPKIVTSIDEYAFQNCTDLTSVTIPNSVTSIGYRAFYGCSGLTSFTFPNSVTSIGNMAFRNCTGLTSVYLGTGVTSGLSSAFNGCTEASFYVPLEIYNQVRSNLYYGGKVIYIMNGNKVESEIVCNAPYNFTTYYDYDGDGAMEYLSSIQEYKDNKSIYHYGFYDNAGQKKIELPDQNGSSYQVTPKNGNGDLLFYNEGDYRKKYFEVDEVGNDLRLIADVDNDGRKDLVGAVANDDFPIYYQHIDGTFKFVDQSTTLDAAAVEAEINKKNSGGVVSFSVGMMVGPGSASSYDYLTGLDMNDDGILDLMDTNVGGILYSYADNKYWKNPKKGVLYPCDLNGDSELDYICYDGSNIILMVRKGGGTFEEKTLFTNKNVKQIIYKDFDHDGDIDILAYINDASYTSNSTANTFFVFFRNDGDLSFKRRERNFAVNYSLLEVKDVDADGLYEMSVYDYTNELQKLLRINADLTVTEDVIDMSDRVLTNNYKDLPIVIGDFNNDGKIDYRYTVGSHSVFGSKYGRFSDAVNSAPNKMEKPTAMLNAETGRLRINWKQGTDKETSSCDLTYELRIGTEPASSGVLFGASLADGTRRTLEDGNMGRSLSTLFNANSLKPGKYYISVQAIDAGGRGGAWSDDFVYEHQLTAPVIVSNYIDHMSTADTLRLSVKTPIDGAEYKWNVSEGRQIESDAGDMRFIFEHDGKHTVTLAMTYDGRTLSAESLTLDVNPVKPYKWISGVNYAGGFVDLNQDGYPEYLGYVNNGKGIMEKVLLSYATDIPSEQKDYHNARFYIDYNMDGCPDVIVRNNVYINLGEQDNDFDMFNQTFSYYEYNYSGYTPLTYIDANTSGWFDANNDGYLDNYKCYNDGTNIVWRKFDNNIIGTYNRYLMYDINRDGFMDIVKVAEKSNLYVMYKDATANIVYSDPQLMWEKQVGSNWTIEDLNNDGYADIVFYSGNTLTVVKGSSTLPYTETVTYDLPGDIQGIISIRDYNNDGYMDVLLYYEKNGNSTYAFVEFGPDFSMKLVDLENKPHEDYFMVQKDGGYPDGNLSHITNTPPSAPATVAAKQTKDGMLITWSDAEDDHTPAMQMRYNISVKRKGKKGDNSFVISPMNGLKDEATICGTIMYKKSTQMLVPSSVLMAGETYEIQVQAIDLWNQHSPMTKAIEFTMTSSGYIDVAEQVTTNKETTVKFVGTNAGSYSLNAGTDATIVSDKGNGEYIVKWTTNGVKDITLKAGNATVKSSITVVKPIDLTFAVPAIVFAKVPLTIEVSDEMAKAAKNVGLRCNNNKVKVEYVMGSKTAKVTFPAKGTYTLEAYSTDDVKGNTYSQTVKVTADMPNAAIEKVDVDSETGSYVINWDASVLPSGIGKMIVSKEGSSLGTFNEIVTVDATAGSYTDMSSNSAVMASRYRIRLVADNGQESAVSEAHRPLHVMLTKAVAGYNLIWDEYEGMNVESYNILRGSSPDNMEQIAQVAGSICSYTDITAPSGANYYAVTFTPAKPQAARGYKHATNASDVVSSNVISTKEALDVVSAQSLELIILDEDKTLHDEHADLQLYYMLLPTYSTITKVKWEIIEGAELATVDANGKLHSTGGTGTVKVRVSTIDGSGLSAEAIIATTVTATEETGIHEIYQDASSDGSEAVLKAVRYFTLDGKNIDYPAAGQIYIEWKIYSNGQIVSRKMIKR